MSGEATSLTSLANAKGEFVRKESSFRNLISKTGPYPPEADRYHLYVSMACPWAHRALIARKLKGLDNVIGISIVHYLMGEKGWAFGGSEDGCIPDPVNNSSYVSELYFLSDPNYAGRYSVPVLFDKKTKTIVNNESAEILRMLNTEFNEFATNPSLDLYPESLRPRIDELNEIILNGYNSGVYKAGFATAQAAYDENAKLVYETLLMVEGILAKNEFLCGDVFTEADIRLFTTTVRFDVVYYGHFKCNLIAVRELPNLSRWLKQIYEFGGIKETVNMEHIKKHYYMSHKHINPTGIVPLYTGVLGN